MVLGRECGHYANIRLEQ